MKRDLMNVVGALSLGALALTGCKSDGGGEQPAAEKTADGEGGCSPGSGKSECKAGKSECKAGKSECKAG